MKRLIPAILIFWTLVVPLLILLQTRTDSQTSPGWSQGFVPTSAQWNTVFANKQDYLGSPACATGGCTMNGPLTTKASATGAAGFTLPVGVAPTTPSPGDLWMTGNALFGEINGNPILISSGNAAQPFITPVSINFNSGNTDTAVPIPYPVGYSRFQLITMYVSGASGTLSTATIGLFGAPGGSTPIASNQAVTVTTGAANTAGNLQTISGDDTRSFSVATVYIRIGTPQGVAATGLVSFRYVLL